MGAEDTGIRPLLLIAQGKDLFKLGESKPAGLQWGVLSPVCRGSIREVSLTEICKGLFAHSLGHSSDQFVVFRLSMFTKY